MKPRNSSILVAALAAAGALVAPVATSTAAQNVNSPAGHEQSAAIANGTSSRQIQADHFQSYANGIRDSFMRDTGMNPRDWGMSRACARMVHRSHLRSLGIGRRRG